MYRMRNKKEGRADAVMANISALMKYQLQLENHLYNFKKLKLYKCPKQKLLDTSNQLN